MFPRRRRRGWLLAAVLGLIALMIGFWFLVLPRILREDVVAVRIFDRTPLATDIPIAGRASDTPPEAGSAPLPSPESPPEIGFDPLPPLPTTPPPPAAGPPPATAPQPVRDTVVMPSETSGELLIPVQGVRPEDLVDTYTQARGQGRTHDAIDIAAPRGTPVLAAADGRIVKLFLSDAGGITLYQLAPDGRTVYYYAHLDDYAPGIAEGNLLRRGDTLGYVGDTGNAGAGNYHLHFGVSITDDPERWWGGTPVNPYPLLRGRE